MRSHLANLALAVCVYSFAAWIYVALVALLQPRTLSWQLTHFAAWPRTDTFGEVCFLLSFLAFIAHRTLRQEPRRR